MILDRTKDAKDLWGNIESLRHRVADGFGEWLRPVQGDGEELPDHAFSLELVARKIMAARERLLIADREYGGRAERSVRHHRECDRFALEKLRPAVVNARRQIDGLFGREEGAALHGLKGKTRRTAPALEIQVEEMVSSLRRHRDEPAVLSNGQTIQVGDFLSEVQQPYDRLVELRRELLELEDRERAARARRKQEIKAFDAVYFEALHYVKAMFHLAGFRGRVIRGLRSYVQRRRLSRWARSKREAYAAAKNRPEPRVEKPPVLRMTARIAGWLGWSRGTR